MAKSDSRKLPNVATGSLRETEKLRNDFAVPSRVVETPLHATPRHASVGFYHLVPSRVTHTLGLG